MSFLQKLLYVFSTYTGPSERKVGSFFTKLRETSPKQKTFAKLAALMQQNIVAINVWTESAFKGYKYLGKRKRAELYANADAIIADFELFEAQNTNTIDTILFDLKRLGIDTQHASNNSDKLLYIKAIMDYFSPHNRRYQYRASSTFGELLKNPANEQLVGDCNQIVTLYIYLYSLRYDISDLQLVTYPGHVALHFNGIDIEATNGQFMHYNEKDQQILPILEIVSINLLDTTDSYFKTHTVKPEAFLQSARMAYLVSSNRDIVANNLRIAYSNTVSELTQKNDFTTALKFAKQSNNSELLHITGHNGAVYYLGKKQFSNALKFAEYSTDKKDLIKAIHNDQAITYYNNGEFIKAIKYFKIIGNNDAIKQCYVGLYMNEQKKLSKMQTANDVKQNHSTIRTMQKYAKKSQNKKLIEYTNSLSKYL